MIAPPAPWRADSRLNGYECRDLALDVSPEPGEPDDPLVATLVRRRTPEARADEQGVRLSATNDGDIPTSPTPGFGIIGMMERAALLGGTCHAGPAPGGGWAVTAVLPRVGWAP